MISKGNDWVASIVSGVIVGGLISGANLLTSKTSSNNDKLVEVATKVEYLTQAVNKLTEQPYVRRSEFDALSDRVTGLSDRVDQWEQRADRQGSRRTP